MIFMEIYLLPFIPHLNAEQYVLRLDFMIKANHIIT